MSGGFELFKPLPSTQFGGRIAAGRDIGPRTFGEAA